MKRALVLLVLLFAVTGSVAGQAGAARASTKGTERLQTLEQDILTRLNAVRAAHGVRPLVLSADLGSAAVAHSRAMLDHGFFEHESYDGTSFSDRIKRFYRSSGYDAWTVGENLLYSTGEISAQASITAWLESPGHRANMLAPNWREVGIGALRVAAAGGTYGGEPVWVITMDFGARTGGPDAARYVTYDASEARAALKKAARAKAARAKAARAKAARAKAAQAKAEAAARLAQTPKAGPPPPSSVAPAAGADDGGSEIDSEHDTWFVDHIFGT